MTLRMTVLCHETPFPPNHGGRADMWRRLIAMEKRGVEIQLISWDYGELTADRAASINNVVKNHQYIPLQRTLAFRAKHILGLLRYPWFACIRWPGPNLSTITQSVRDFSPDLIFLDGWHGALLAFHLQKALDLPIYYRSQNIEHEYIRVQYKHADTTRSRLVTFVAGLHLKTLEYQIMNRSAGVYDISMEDVAYWKAHGFHHVQYLPPLFPTDFDGETSSSSPNYDLVFLGNLNTPNNISGVTWLIDKVMPIVWHDRPATTLCIAGSNPNLQFLDYLGESDNVRLVLNPADANKVLAQGRISLNPVATAGGVQIKNIDNLMVGHPIITRSTGVIGLPYEVRECFAIADSAQEFALAILRMLSKPSSHFDWAMLASHFGAERITIFLQDIEHKVLYNRSRHEP